MSTKPWYAWYVGDWKAKTSGMSLAEKGAYRELLDHYMATATGLPDDIERLCRIVGASGVTEITAVKTVVESFFKRGADGLMHNNRADKELIRLKDFADEQSRKGKLSAVKRWGNRPKLPVTDDNRALTEGVTEAQPDCNQPQPQLHTTVTTTTTKSNTRASPKPQKRAIPDGWKPSQATAESLTREFNLPATGIERYTQAFLDTCKANGYNYADFEAAFRNCVRKDWPQYRANGAMKPQRKTAAELIDEAELQRQQQVKH